MVDVALTSTKAHDLLLSLIEAVKEVPSAPCDDCAKADRCATQSLACLTFYQYFTSPRGRYDPDALRAPKTEIYARAFGRDSLIGVASVRGDHDDDRRAL